MKSYHKIAALGLSSLFFFGCSSGDDVEYVRTTQFQALEKKIEILSENQKTTEESLKSIRKILEKKDDGKKDEDTKFELLEQNLNKLQSDFEKIDQDFAANQETSKEQLKEMESVLKNLEKIKDHYLKNANLSLDPSANAGFKNAPSLDLFAAKDVTKKSEEKAKETVIDLEEETEKAAEKTKNLSEKSEISFVKKTNSGGKDFLMFEKCELDSACDKFLIEEKFFKGDLKIPDMPGESFEFSGELKSIGKIVGEEYFIVSDGFELNAPQGEKPQTGISPFEAADSGAGIMDKMMN